MANKNIQLKSIMNLFIRLHALIVVVDVPIVVMACCTE